MRRCTTHALYQSKLLQQDHCLCHHWIATNNRDVPRVIKTKFPATVMVFGVVSSEGYIIYLSLPPTRHDLTQGQVKATSCHLTSSKSAWKSTPKCTWMCWRVWWSPGAIRWSVADPRCGSKTRRRPASPKRPRLGFRRSATTLYPSLTGCSVVFFRTTILSFHPVLICALLLVPNNGDNVLAKSFAMLWGVVPIPEMIGL